VQTIQKLRVRVMCAPEFANIETKDVWFTQITASSEKPKRILGKSQLKLGSQPIPSQSRGFVGYITGMAAEKLAGVLEDMSMENKCISLREIRKKRALRKLERKSPSYA